MKIYCVELNDFYNFTVEVFSSFEKALDWINKQPQPDGFKLGKILTLDPTSVGDAY